MRFLADVNVPQLVITSLSSSGHDVLYLKSNNPKSTDKEIVQLARVKKRVIITLDKDFISLTQYPKHQVPTIVIRLKKQNPRNIGAHLEELLKNQKAETLEKSLTIIFEDVADSYPFKLAG